MENNLSVAIESRSIKIGQCITRRYTVLLSIVCVEKEGNVNLCLSPPSMLVYNGLCNKTVGAGSRGFGNHYKRRLFRLRSDSVFIYKNQFTIINYRCVGNRQYSFSSYKMTTLSIIKGQSFMKINTRFKTKCWITVEVE